MPTYELVKLNELSGNKASVYSLLCEEDNETLYEKFILENINSFKSEIIDINTRINTIGKKTGARFNFFKHKEGVPGDGVCALYDDPDKNLRLYCIRYGSLIVILGGGGHKPKNIKALQEDEKLTKENNLLKAISQEISSRIKDREISYTNDHMDFEGDLIFYYEED